MNIAIFGDSYADSSHSSITDLPYSNLTWTSKVGENYTARNFATCGSGLEYMYWKFTELENTNGIALYDKIIFCLGDVRRMYVHPDYHYRCKSEHIVLSSLQNKKNLSSIEKAALDTYKYFGIDELYEIRYTLIAEDLKDKYGDKILLLPCFDTYKDSAIDFLDTTISLRHIQEQEDKEIVDNLSHEQRLLYEEFKLCHLTTQSHSVLFDAIQKWIHGEKFIIDVSGLPKVETKDSLEYNAFIDFSQKPKKVNKKLKDIDKRGF